jgi:ubiquinone/menaquinone biosynthesis C-methylase UbiE
VPDYDLIAPYYDTIHGSRGQAVRYAKHLIKTFHPKAESILCLACGTGSMVKALSKKYTVAGLDISPHMLKIAQQKIRHATFYLSDMCDLDISETFDVITCFYASLNHVNTFEKWQQVFERVSAHLNPGGVFVFDVITETGLYNLVLNSPLLLERKRCLTVGDIRLAEDGHSVLWNVKGYRAPHFLTQLGCRLSQKKRRKIAQSVFSKPVFEVDVQHVSFDVDEIYKALAANFKTVYTDDPEQESETPTSEMLYFIAIKKQ